MTRKSLLPVIVATLLAVLASPAAAATVRVKDIYPGAMGSFPDHFAVMKVGGKRILFFAASHPSRGVELWRSDGTAGGTRMVKDINLGPGGSSPTWLTVMKVGKKQVLFFRATDGSSGDELWRSNGKAGGTRRVKDINLGGNSSDPAELTVVKLGVRQLLFFSANDGSSGYELWRSDGKAGGTRLVKNIRSGSGDANPSELTALKAGRRQVLLFGADDGSSGTELWRSDGTAGGTRRVKDIYPGTGDSGPAFLTVMKVGKKHIAFFQAEDQTGAELWRSNGKAGGTRRVKDINAGPGGSSPDQLAVLKDGNRQTLFFGAFDTTFGHELWRSDGTTDGTRRVKDINGSGNSNPQELTPMKVGKRQVLFFAANDGSSGYELWRSDGKAGRTKRVRDIHGSGSSFPSGLTVMRVGKKQMLFFRAGDGASGNELWRSNGTSSGTTIVKDINGSGNSNPEELTPMKVAKRQALFFRADDGSSGHELWRHKP